MKHTEIQKFQNWLDAKFLNVNVFPADEPIRNSIHCTDYDIDGTLVRGRWFSPHHKGDKRGLMFYVVTEEQKAELKEIEERFAKEKSEKKRKSAEARNFSLNLLVKPNN